MTRKNIINAQIIQVKATHNNPIVFLDNTTHYLVNKNDVERLPREVKEQMKHQINYDMGIFNRNQLDKIMHQSVKAGHRIAILTQL